MMAARALLHRQRALQEARMRAAEQPLGLAILACLIALAIVLAASAGAAA